MENKENNKNQKNIIIVLLIIIICLLIGIIIILLFQNKKNEEKKYKAAIIKYERMVRIAKQANEKIDEEVTKAQAFIDQKPNVGEATSTITRLQEMVDKLENLKIEIPPKSENLKELNEANENLENQILQVDDTIPIDAPDGETGEADEDIEIVFGEDSNLNILISNVGALTEDVNQAVKTEEERIAEIKRQEQEEAARKAAEEEAKKKAEEEKANQNSSTNSVLAQYAGTYYAEHNPSEILTLSANGKVTIAGRVFTEKPQSVTKQADGSYWCLTKAGEMIDDGYYIYPVGVAGGGSSADKVRITVCEAMGALVYIKQ